jgi:cyclic pyranopterin phosphate synthase
MGEPTMRLEEVLKIIEWLSLRRLRSRLVTNGLARLVNPGVDVVADLAAAGLDSVSVSLVAHNSEVYNQLCRPVFSKAYREMLRFAEDCIKQGISVELTVVNQPEVDVESCRSIAAKMGADFRIRPLLKKEDLEVTD